MVEIRLATNADKFRILQLLNQELGENRYFNWHRDEAFWNWKYEENIFGETSLLVAESDGKIVATNAYWPWRLISRGLKINAVQSCDTVVESNFQGQGIFTMLMKKRVPDAVESGIAIVYNFPNEKAVYGFKKLGWHYLANIPWLVKPLRPVHLFRSLSVNEKADSVEVEKVHTLDAGFCYNLHKQNVGFDSSIQTDRSADYFKWRYSQHPFFSYGMVTVNKGQKETSAIFSVYEKGSHRQMVIVDVIGSKVCSKELFREVVKTARDYRADYITTIYNPWVMASDLWKSGFFKVKRKNMVVLPLNPAYEQKVTNYDNWQIAASMHDAI